jgi:putative Mn2+ efflux pump MntP
MWTIVAALRSGSAAEAQDTRVQTMSVGGSVLLGGALAMNNVALGVAVGATAVPIVPLTVLSGAFSLAFVGGGARIARSVAGGLPKRRAFLASGTLMVLLGIYELFV